MSWILCLLHEQALLQMRGIEGFAFRVLKILMTCVNPRSCPGAPSCSAFMFTKASQGNPNHLHTRMLKQERGNILLYIHRIEDLYFMYTLQGRNVPGLRSNGHGGVAFWDTLDHSTQPIMKHLPGDRMKRVALKDPGELANVRAPERSSLMYRFESPRIF